MTIRRHISITGLDARKLDALRLAFIVKEASKIEAVLEDVNGENGGLDLYFVSAMEITNTQKDVFRQYVRSLLG